MDTRTSEEITTDIAKLNPENKFIYLVGIKRSVEGENPNNEIIHKDLAFVATSAGTIEDMIINKKLGEAFNFKQLPWKYIETKCPKDDWYLVDTKFDLDSDSSDKIYLVKACSIFSAHEAIQQAIEIIPCTPQVKIAAIQKFDLDVIV